MMDEKTTETKKTKKKRFIRPWIIRLLAVILLVVNFYILYVLAYVERIGKVEDEVESRFSRLYNSLVTATEQTTSVTASFDSWYVQRLIFLQTITDFEGGDYSLLTGFGSRYLPDHAIYLYNRAEDRILSKSGADLSAEDQQLLKAANTIGSGLNGKVSNEEGDILYYRNLNDELTAVIRVEYMEFFLFLDNIYTPEEILENNLRDGDNIVFAVKDGTIFIHPDYTLIDRKLEDVLESMGSMPFQIDDFISFQLIRMNGTPMLAINNKSESLDFDLYYCIPMSAFESDSKYITAVVGIFMVLFLFLFVEYVYFLKTDYVNLHRVGDFTKTGVRYKAVAFAVIALIVVGGSAYYAHTLYGLTDFIEGYKATLFDVNYTIEDNKLSIRDMQADFDNNEHSVAKMVSGYLSDYPERRTREILQRFSDIFNLDFIMMFDTNGREILTNSDYIGYSISSDPEASSYKFNSLKKGVESVIGPLEVDDLTNSAHQIIGVTTKDTSGHVDGFLQTVFYPQDLKDGLKATEYDSLFGNSVVTNIFECFLIDSETKQIVYSPISDMIGKTATDAGFKEADLHSDFTGYVTLKYLSYYMASSHTNEMLIFIGIPVNSIFRGRLKYTAVAVLLFGLDLLILSLMLRKVNVKVLPQEERVAPEVRHDENGIIYMIVGEENEIPHTLGERWKIIKKKWPHMVAEEKIGLVISNLLLIMAIGFTIAVIFRNQIYGDDSMISYIISGNWPRGLNVFAVSAAIVVIIGAYIAITLITGLLDLLARILNARARTFCHLFKSIAEYVIFIAAFMSAMSLLGVDVKAIAASVGFLTLIIGFGAKSLITDIVAGIFIIFENEFQVGDIVEINGYRGMVKEIGLRTTKILSWDKNVKTINNHDISTVVNMTTRNSIASVNFSISVKVPISELENIFTEELPKLKEKYPMIIGTPFFSGVLSFSGSKMDCCVSAEVEELKRGDMKVILHKEVQDILMRHDISLA